MFSSPPFVKSFRPGTVLLFNAHQKSKFADQFEMY